MTEIGLGPCGALMGQSRTKGMSGMHEFVLRGGQTVTAGMMTSLQPKLPLLKVKAETMVTPDFPLLHDQIGFLVRYAEDVLDGVYACDDLSAIAETIFALNYLLKETDIIPDSVPGLGYADDAAVIRAVMQGHKEEFKKYSEKYELDFVSVFPHA